LRSDVCDDSGSGFITPPDLGLYTLTLKLRARMQTDFEGRTGLGSDERVRLWLDNKLIFDQWDSLSSGIVFVCTSYKVELFWKH